MTEPLALSHRPVMREEMLRCLAPADGRVIIDGTFGAGGYSEALLAAADCRVFAIDRDPAAIQRGRALAARFPGRLTLLHGRFGDMGTLLGEVGVTAVDGVALDVGVSSLQLDDPARGFSFRADGPLDMRMDPAEETSAATLVNEAGEAELARIIATFGEERRAAAVARAIVRARAEGPILKTATLAEIVRRVVRPSRDGIDPATRTFQALRIVVNQELDELMRGLVAAEALLRAGGVLVVVTFHSLEDRRVKSFLRERAGEAPQPSRHRPQGAPPHAPSFERLTRRPLRAGAAEIAANPRARSANLRAGRRTAAPAWPAAREARP